MQLSSNKMIARKDNGIGWVIFNNPDKRNALTHDMRKALLEIFDAYDADDEVRVIVLKGAGDKAFVSGADISQFDEGDRAAREDVSHKAWARYGQSPKPVIAMIHGYCLGGGLLVALNADLRIAADDAQFGVPAARLGIAYPYDGVRKLVDSVGPIKAKEILFTGQRYNAGQAAQMGLVNEVVPLADLENRVRAIADILADNAPLSMRASKVLVDEICKPPEDRDLEACNAVTLLCANSEDLAEGKLAFKEKRRPVFKGR
ncbi:MAG: enoyl-CoA hydratase/isomerase family protein [Hyphomicrobiales bacterium]|nr:enoyl-CoA hydratase/isomerase family protein [Hyphomicrobiales bacterium]